MDYKARPTMLKYFETGTNSFHAVTTIEIAELDFGFRRNVLVLSILIVPRDLESIKLTRRHQMSIVLHTNTVETVFLAPIRPRSTGLRLTLMWVLGVQLCHDWQCLVNYKHSSK